MILYKIENINGISYKWFSYNNIYNGDDLIDVNNGIEDQYKHLPIGYPVGLLTAICILKQKHEF